jgi:molybdopterin-guanine dinucleotide biosynthesis protein A
MRIVPDRLPVVVLAGGNSRRFQGDKLRAPLNGQSVLSHVIQRVSPLASEVLIATSSEARSVELAPELPSTVRFLFDRSDQWGNGPAAAMASARQELRNGPILFVPGDVPWIETTALRQLVTRASQRPVELASPLWQSGETEHLIQWQRSAEILSFLPWSRSSLIPRSWRASEFLRAVPRTLLVSVAALTNRPESFSHLTLPEDLQHPAARGEAGSGTSDRIVAGIPKRAYRAAQAARVQRDWVGSAREFTEESRWYAGAGLTLLARHAASDATMVLATRAGRKFSATRPGSRASRLTEEPETDGPTAG